MSAEPPPKQPSALWKWVKRIGCALFILAFLSCFLTCTGAWLLERSVHNMNKEDVDRFHRDGMQNGDVKAMFERADPKFRARFTLEDLETFLNERPGILERDNLRGADFSKRIIDGVEYVKVKSKRHVFAWDEWEIICKVVDGALVLVGFSPGMDELVPAGFHWRRSSGRRHHH